MIIGLALPQEESVTKEDKINDLLESSMSMHKLCFGQYCVDENMSISEIRSALYSAKQYPFYSGAMVTMFEQVCSLQ